MTSGRGREHTSTMPKVKRPRDPNQLAKLTVDIAAPRPSRAPARRRNWRGGASSKPVPTTSSWRMSWRPSGTPRSRALDDARRELKRRRAEDTGRLDDARRERILSLVTDFPQLCTDPPTPDRERTAKLLIDNVTITRSAEIALGVRLRRGARTPCGCLPDFP